MIHVYKLTNYIDILYRVANIHRSTGHISYISMAKRDIHKVNKSGFRKKPVKILKCPAVSFPADESNLDVRGSVVEPLDHSVLPSSFARRRSIKDRRSSSTDGASIEKAIRILKTIRALKEVERIERSLTVPSPYGSETQKSDLPTSDTWSCVLANSTTRRHFVQSLTNEIHVTTNPRPAEEVHIP